MDRFDKNKERKGVGLPPTDRFYASKTVWRRSNPLTQLRLAKGYTVGALADQLGWKVSRLGATNTGRHRATLEEVQQVANLFGVPGMALYAEYLSWLSLEPTLHRQQLKKLGMSVMRKLHPANREATKIGMRLDDVCHSAGVPKSTFFRAVSDPLANPTLRTVERIAHALAVCPGDFVDRWIDWSEHFAGLSGEDIIVAAIEFEGKLEDVE